MEGECCSMAEDSIKAGGPPPPQTERRSVAAQQPSKDRPFRGVRMRKWGKWVAEIREPNKRSRIWLGSYSTAVAAARAYDTAVYYLRGRSARLNFPDEISPFPEDDAAAGPMSAASIRKKATEVGARVDAIQAGLVLADPPRRFKNPDLNRKPSPDLSDLD